MTFKATGMFVNLPIRNLKKTVDFFTELGFEFNAQFTDETTTCMLIGDNMYAMLLEDSRFTSFSEKEVPDASKTAEVILALSVESRAQVDEIVHKAEAAGARPTKQTDHGFMYQWGFEDLDGHLWEVFYMNMDAANGS